MEDKIFLCVFGALLYVSTVFADSRMVPSTKISIKSFFMEIIFLFSVHSAAVTFLAKMLPFGVNSRLPLAGLGRKERKE